MKAFIKFDDGKIVSLEETEPLEDNAFNQQTLDDYMEVKKLRARVVELEGALEGRAIELKHIRAELVQLRKTYNRVFDERRILKVEIDVRKKMILELCQVLNGSEGETG